MEEQLANWMFNNFSELTRSQRATIIDAVRVIEYVRKQTQADTGRVRALRKDSSRDIARAVEDALGQG